MNRIKRKLRSILVYLPPSLNSILIRLYHQIYYKTEIQLIKGIHQNYNDHASIIHFSFNKAATQYVRTILMRIAIENEMDPVRFHNFAFNTEFPYLDQLSEEELLEYQHLFKSTGYLYTVFGGMIEGIPNLEMYKVILITRDLRDLLVSEYFSTVYSHPLSSSSGDKHNKFIEKRNRASKSSIDEYVISQCDRIYAKFLRYQTLLVDQYDNVYISKYEDMISDFGIWLKNLINYCELDVSEKLFQQLLKENENKKPKSENIHKHLRKGQPGDYLEKLNSDTIQLINKKFDPILTKFGYK